MLTSHKSMCEKRLERWMGKGAIKQSGGFKHHPLEGGRCSFFLVRKKMSINPHVGSPPERIRKILQGGRLYMSR